MKIAIDFDGTCVTHEYPAVGKDIGAAPILKELVAAGHQLILWTMRSENTLDDAVWWFKRNNIPLFGVNQNPEQHTWTRSPKAYAKLYIDDAALGAPLIYPTTRRAYLDWPATSELLRESGVLEYGN